MTTVKLSLKILTLSMVLGLIFGSYSATKADGSESAVSLRQVWLFPNDVAWGESEGAIWRTTDNGATWTNVLAIPTDLSRVRVAARSDSEIAVAVGGDSRVPGGVRLYSSADGGAKWFETQVRVASYIGLGVTYASSLDWLSNQKIAVLMRPNVGMNSSNGSLLFVTPSGSEALVSSTSAGHGSLPSGLGQVNFRNVNTGFLEASLTTTTNGRLYLSIDSGRRWSRVNLVDGYIPIGAPQYMTSQKTWILYGRLRAARSSTSSTCAVLSTQAGSNVKWRVVGSCSYQINVEGSTVSPQFVSPESGWEIRGRQMMQTVDGGKHWSKLYKGLPPVSSDILQFDRQSKETAWVLVSKPDGESQILSTADGGKSWRRINPERS